MIKCSVLYTGSRVLRVQEGSGTDVRIRVSMIDIFMVSSFTDNVDQEVSDARYSARVRFRGSVICMGRIVEQ